MKQNNSELVQQIIEKLLPRVPENIPEIVPIHDNASFSNPHVATAETQEQIVARVAFVSGTNHGWRASCPGGNSGMWEMLRIGSAWRGGSEAWLLWHHVYSSFDVSSEQS